MLTVAMVFAVCLAFAGCGAKTDYASPQKAVEAFQNGENIVGKTVEVTATMNYAPTLNGEGMIFSYVDPTPIQIWVCPVNNSGTDVVSGQIVTFRISNVDTGRPGTVTLLGTVEG